VATDSAQIILTGQGLQQLPFVFQLADEFDSNMRTGFNVGVGQGIVIIAGALLSVVGIVGGTLIWSAALLAGLGIAYLPLHRHQRQDDTGPGAITRRN
jgi:Cu2+-exporting ATPase